MAATRDDYLAYELDTREDLAGFHPEAERSELIGAWLDVELARIGDEAFARGFSRGCPCEGAQPEAYWPRHLTGSPNVLAGIRFKGGDVTAPFVELIASDGPLDWSTLLERVRAEFAVFAPRWLRVRLPGDAKPPVAAEVDQLLVAERVGVLRARPQPTSTLATRRARSLDWFDAFSAAYAEWQAAAGALGSEVSPASRPDLEDCLESGAVVVAEASGAWAGVAAAERQTERALRGFCMVEELLAPPLRGHGLAAPLQRALIDALPASDDDVLWGTIHGSNVPSLRTALRCGRRVVETWWFAELGAT